MKTNSTKHVKLVSYLFSIIFVIACGLGTPTPGGDDSKSPAPTENSQMPTPTVSSSNQQIDNYYYNLPQATLKEATGLFASPNRGEWIVQTEIPVGDIVYVMGKNATGSHLRVVWHTGVGWIPVSFTNYIADREKMQSLPVFKREPPACAEPLATQFSLNSEWSNIGGQKRRIAVVVDLFRSRFGDFPTSYLSLTVNGNEVESSRRQIVEKGQFTLKDVVFTLPNYVLEGDKIGYRLDTSSNEPLAFMATIFNIPENCVWDTN
jgi:hypothetical protein